MHILSSYKAKAQEGWELVWVVVRRACVQPIIILALPRCWARWSHLQLRESIQVPVASMPKAGKAPGSHCILQLGNRAGSGSILLRKSAITGASFGKNNTRGELPGLCAIMGNVVSRSLQCTESISEICRERGETHSANRFHIVLFFFRLQSLGQISSSLLNPHRVYTSAATQRKNWPWFRFLQGKSKNCRQHFVANWEIASISIAK